MNSYEDKGMHDRVGGGDTIPHGKNAKLGIRPGGEKAGGSFERLARVLGDVSFEKEMRIEAEQEAMREASGYR